MSLTARRHFRWDPLLLAAALGLAGARVHAAADQRALDLLATTAQVVFGVGAISLPLGTLLAVLLARTDVALRRTALALLAMLLFVPLYVHAAGWLAGFGPLGTYTLGSAEGAPGQALVYGLWGAIWVHAMAAVPWVAMIVAGGLWLVRPEPEELALLDASAPVVLARVTLPAALPAIGVAALWVALSVAGEMVVTDLMQVRTYAEEIYVELSLGADPAEAWSAILPGMMISASLAALVASAAWRMLPRDRVAAVRPPLRFALGRARSLAAVFVLAVLGLVGGVPTGYLVYKAGVHVRPGADVRSGTSVPGESATASTEARQGTPAASVGDTAVTRRWSAAKCAAVIAEAPRRYGREMGWSVLIGAAAASLALVAAVLLAWPARRGGWAALPALAVVSLLLAVPGPLVGVGVIRLLNLPESALLSWLYSHSIAAPLLAQFARTLPVTIPIVWYALASLGRDMLDAAAVDGAGPVARLVHVALPARGGALAIAWFVAFAVALGELSASVLVLPPGVRTVAYEIFSLLHWSAEDLMAGVTLVVLAAVMLLGAGIAYAAARHLPAE